MRRKEGEGDRERSTVSHEKIYIADGADGDEKAGRRDLTLKVKTFWSPLTRAAEVRLASSEDLAWGRGGG